jgi:hypothetical protein
VRRSRLSLVADVSPPPGASGRDAAATSAYLGAAIRKAPTSEIRDFAAHGILLLAKVQRSLPPDDAVEALLRNDWERASRPSGYYRRPTKLTIP